MASTDDLSEIVRQAEREADQQLAEALVREKDHAEQRILANSLSKTYFTIRPEANPQASAR